MENYGLLVTFLFGLVAALFYFIVACEVIAKKSKEKVRTRALAMSFFIFWVSVSIAAFLVGLRSLFAFLNLVYLDRIVFYAANIPPALWVAPLVFIILYLYTGRSDVSAGASLIFGCAGVAYLFLLYRYGVGQHHLSFWSSEWTAKSELANQVYVFLLFVPSVVASLTLGVIGVLVDSIQVRYRIILIAFSCFLFFCLSMLDATGLFAGITLFLIRLGVVGCSVLAYLAYFPPKFLRKKYGFGRLSPDSG